MCGPAMTRRATAYSLMKAPRGGGALATLSWAPQGRALADPLRLLLQAEEGSDKRCV